MPKLGMKSRGDSTGTVVRFPVAGRPHEPVKLDVQALDLGSVLIVLIERCRRQASPGLTIRLSASPGAGTSIAPVEAATLDYVLGEIVSNAYRHSHPGGSPVEVTMECGVNRDGEIVIDIGD